MQRDVARADAADLGIALDAVGLEIARTDRTQIQTADVGGIDVARTDAGGRRRPDTCRTCRSPEPTLLMQLLATPLTSASPEPTLTLTGMFEGSCTV
jgi:hypothetical protein